MTIGWAKYEKLYFMIAKLRNKVIWSMGAWPTSTTITKTTFYVESNKTIACRLYSSFSLFLLFGFTNIVTFLFKKTRKKRTWFWSPKIISFLKRKILQIFSAFKRDRSLFIYLFIFHFIQRKIIDGVDLSGWAKMFLSNGWEDKWGIWCVIWLLSTIEVYCCPIFPFLDKTERKRK